MSQNSRNKCFSYYFCLMIEGSWSGYVSLTNGSGSGRPKYIWILRIRIWIWNTAYRYSDTVSERTVHCISRSERWTHIRATASSISRFGSEFSIFFRQQSSFVHMVCFAKSFFIFLNHTRFYRLYYIPGTPRPLFCSFLSNFSRGLHLSYRYLRCAICYHGMVLFNVPYRPSYCQKPFFPFL